MANPEGVARLRRRRVFSTDPKHSEPLKAVVCGTRKVSVADLGHLKDLCDPFSTFQTLKAKADLHNGGTRLLPKSRLLVEHLAGRAERLAQRI